jgi:hypothetical protein
MSMNIETILAHYLIAALWSSTDDNGDPLDDHCDIDDVHPDSVASAHEDIEDFVSLLEREGIDYPGSEEQFGHDFWLTRNHHGAGFWDRGLGKLGDDLTKWAHAAGGSDAYIGDDARVHLS